MRHRVAHRKLGRVTSHRTALLRNLATALFDRERIRTTLPKAKELRPFAEKLITLARRGNRRKAEGTPEGKAAHLHAVRRAAQLMPFRPAVRKLFGQVAPAVGDRAGGYTRIVRIGTSRIVDRAAPKPPKPPDPDHYYRPYWS